MAKGYYTVIVGTQPGVYADWAQAASTVIGISGAVHKKYKTHSEACEAFNRAGREGKVRAIPVDPQPGDFGEPDPISAATFLSVVPDNHRQRNFHEGAQDLQSALPACAAGCSTCHPTTPPVRRSSQRDRTANSTTNDVTWPIRREPGDASRYTSSPVSAPNIDLGNSIGVGELRRTTSEYHGNSGQPLRTPSGSGSPSPLSLLSRPAGRSRVYEHADFPSREFSSWQNANRQNNERGTAAPPDSPRASSTATQHREAGAAGTSAEIGRRTRESPSPSPLRSWKTSQLTHGTPGESQVEDITARTYRQLLDQFLLVSDARETIGSGHSPIQNTLGDQFVGHDEGEESRNRVRDFLSRLGQAHSQGDDYNSRRASLQSVDTSLDSSDNIQRVQSSHTQSEIRTESHYSFELSPSTASGLGLQTGVASPRHYPLPPAAQTLPESPVGRLLRSIDAQSPTRDAESSRDAPQQDHASSPHLSAATPEDTQSVGTGPIDRASLYHYNIPLPPSPVSSVSDSFTRLQVQPAHRHSPRMPMYPSLAVGENPELLSPSGLDVGFGLPTPRLSPMQTPVVVRSPSVDPRSPVPTRMRIPGDIMGLLGAFLQSGHGLAHASLFLFFFQIRLFWSSYASSG
ncbi:hypothetical protein BJY52DRAFT_1253152 [Lactarius psammicola]|nr:hypothetical protein BJY52DRAFT_1253152 [Lactarius psammicola]